MSAIKINPIEIDSERKSNAVELADFGGFKAAPNCGDNWHLNMFSKNFRNLNDFNWLKLNSDAENFTFPERLMRKGDEFLNALRTRANPANVNFGPTGNSSVLAGLTTQFKVMVMDGYNQYTPWSDQFYFDESGSSESIVSVMLRDVPQVQEWLTDRKFNQTGPDAIRLTARWWELSAQVPIEFIEDDQLGLYKQLGPSIGRAWKYWPDKMCADLIINGTSTNVLCADGKAFFATDHAVNTGQSSLGTQSNLVSGSTLTQATFFAGLKTFQLLKLGNGQPSGIVPNLLIVPPSLRQTALTICKAALVVAGTDAGGNTNVSQGLCDVLVVPELEANSSTSWYLANTTMVKPFRRWMRSPVKMINRLAPDSDNVALKRRYEWCTDARAEFGYGDYRGMIKFTT